MTQMTPATIVGDLVSCFNGGEIVCQIDDAAISNVSELQAALPSGAVVGVIKQDGVEGSSNTAIADAVKDATNAQTVVIIEDKPGNDTFGVSSDFDAAAISEALYSQGASDGGIATAAEADTLVGAPSQVEVEGAQPADAGFGGVVVGGLLVVVAIAAFGGILFFGLKKLKKDKDTSAFNPAQLTEALAGEDGEVISRELDTLRKFAQADPHDEIAEPLERMVTHITQVFVRARTRSTDQDIRMMQVNYRDILENILVVVNDSYYRDMKKNPLFYNDQTTRIAEIIAAIEATDKQALVNIKQINEGRDIDFKTAISSLKGPEGTAMI